MGGMCVYVYDRVFVYSFIYLIVYVCAFGLFLCVCAKFFLLLLCLSMPVCMNVFVYVVNVCVYVVNVCAVCVWVFVCCVSVRV